MIRESSVTSVISAVFQNSRSAFWIGPNCHTSFQANPALWVFLLPISSSLPLCHFAAGRRGWAHWGTNKGRVVQSSSYKIQGEVTWARSTQHLGASRASSQAPKMQICKATSAAGGFKTVPSCIGKQILGQGCHVSVFTASERDLLDAWASLLSSCFCGFATTHQHTVHSRYNHSVQPFDSIENLALFQQPKSLSWYETRRSYSHVTKPTTHLIDLFEMARLNTSCST